MFAKSAESLRVVSNLAVLAKSTSEAAASIEQSAEAETAEAKVK